MSKTERDLRRYAAECFRTAESSDSADERQMFIEMGEAWLELADEREKTEGRQPMKLFHDPDDDPDSKPSP